MIEILQKYYNQNGEIKVEYDSKHEPLFQKAHRELVRRKREKGLQHHSQELKKLAHDVAEEMLYPYDVPYSLYSLCDGIHKKAGNFASMVVENFLKNHGFKVLLSEEHYLLLRNRNKHDVNNGFQTIKSIFGNGVDKLLEATADGGDPDMFVYEDLKKDQACFVEAKRRGEGKTKKQRDNFPLIEKHLCPVEMAVIIPL